MNVKNLGIPVRSVLLELTARRSARGAGDRTRGRRTMSSAAGVAVALLGAWWLTRAGPALAVSLGDMAEEAADDLETVPGLIAVAFYIIGAAIVGFGLLKLKRHVDHPQQTTFGSGLIPSSSGSR